MKGKYNKLHAIEETSLSGCKDLSAVLKSLLEIIDIKALLCDGELVTQMHCLVFIVSKTEYDINVADVYFVKP